MNVLITGTSSGIGLSLAKYYVSKGHRVYGIANTPMPLKLNMTFFLEDITNYTKINQILENIFKTTKIDILINCAGYGISGSVENTPIDVVKKNFEVNYFAMTNIVSKTITHMRISNGGKIACISSVASILPIAFQTYYSSFKAAINLFLEALQIEVRPYNIKTTLFLPGDVKTNFTFNRQKSLEENTVYEKRLKNSVKVMEHDEQNGIDPFYVAKVIYKNLSKKRPPLRKTVGFKYKFFVFLYRLLPIKVVNKILAIIYGG